MAIVAGLAKATLDPNPKLRWDDWTADYDQIRDLVEQSYPDEFRDFNARTFEPGGFYRGNPARDRTWTTQSGKAEFTAPTVLSAIGAAEAEGRVHAHHAALERPVQYERSTAQRPVARSVGHA